jgi:hypothetical protein
MIEEVWWSKRAGCTEGWLFMYELAVEGRARDCVVCLVGGIENMSPWLIRSCTASLQVASVAKRS